MLNARAKGYPLIWTARSRSDGPEIKVTRSNLSRKQQDQRLILRLPSPVADQRSRVSAVAPPSTRGGAPLLELPKYTPRR
jgi:hypothetical protein